MAADRPFYPDAAAKLGALTNPSMAPLFWPPRHARPRAVWIAHVPFVHWLIDALRPRVLVELGTRDGIAYSACCATVHRLGLDARCIAIADAPVDAAFRGLHDQRYATFSDLWQLAPDEAAARLPDAGVDLLHIAEPTASGGAEHLLAAWQSRLSARAVVLLHGTNRLRPDGGAARLFARLAGEMPSFAFMHGEGLGVLAIGAEPCADVAALCALDDAAAVGTVRDRFRAFAERWRLEAELQALDGMPQRLAASEAMRARAAEAARQARGGAQRAGREADALRSEIDALLQNAAAAERAVADAVLAHHDSLQARALLRESQLREARLQQELGQALADAHRAAAARHRAEREAARLLDLELLLGSGLFDAAWYRARYADVDASGLDPALHYLREGLPEQRDPGPLFDAAAYLATHAEVARAGIGAVMHYIKYGAAEGRQRQPVADAQLDPPATHTPRARGHEPAAAALRLAFLSAAPAASGHSQRARRLAEAAEAGGAAALMLRCDEVGARIEQVGAVDILVVCGASWSQDTATAVAAVQAAAARLAVDLDDPAVFAETQPTDDAGAGRLIAAADFCLAATDEIAIRARRAGKPALVLPSGYDAAMLQSARLAVRRRHQAAVDTLVRIGYLGDARTHGADGVEALVRLLTQREDCRLVLSRDPSGESSDLNPSVLAALPDRIEWRDRPVHLADELARLDVAVLPRNDGDPQCRNEGALPWVAAALVEVPLIATPTDAFRRAIAHGRTGYLATTADEWDDALRLLLADPAGRRRMATAAYLEALWRYGPECRAQDVGLALQQIRGGRAGAQAFELALHRAASATSIATLPDSETVFLADVLGAADVTVAVTLHNQARFVEEALESVRGQTLEALDLIVVDDASTDDGLAVALGWAETHRARFNRVEVRRTAVASGTGASRNAAFAASHTGYVFPLDAANRLRPRCCKRLLAEARTAGAAFAHPVLRRFGEASGRVPSQPYVPARLVGQPHIDAMALVSLAAWAGVGGYDVTPTGCEDADFWCRMAEHGMHGIHVGGEPLAEVRVLDAPATSPVPDTEVLLRRHPWLTVG
jgi:hypothetical protein